MKHVYLSVLFLVIAIDAMAKMKHRLAMPMHFYKSPFAYNLKRFPRYR